MKWADGRWQSVSLHGCWLTFCCDCDHGFICLSRKARRCPLCAKKNARAAAAAKAAKYPATYDPERAAEHRRRWAAANPERARAGYARRAARARAANPEKYHEIARRYRERRRAARESEGIAAEEKRLMDLATRQAVAELRQIQKLSLAREPRSCAYCGDMFLPNPLARRAQIYCGPQCNRWAYALRQKMRRLAIACP